MASDASTMATKPRVSIKPRASSCMGHSLWGGVALPARRTPTGGPDGSFELLAGRRDDVPREDLALARGGGGPGGDGRLDLPQRAADEDADQAVAGDLVARQADAGGLAHGVGCLDGGDQTRRLDQTERFAWHGLRGSSLAR